MRYKRRSHRDYDGDQESIGDDLAAINDRLDELTRHLERVAQSGGKRGAARDQDEHAPDRVSEALARSTEPLGCDSIVRLARKAAAHGVADSQFNLAILYARGIGIEQNLAESYKWFALAASMGDQDAAKKRDEVAGRLDQQTLMAAKLAAQTFTAQREPDEATSLKAPPGGWDRAAVQAAQPKSRPRGPAAP